MIVAHCVSRQETGIAQWREFFLFIARLNYVSTHEIPVVQGIADGILIVTQDLLWFSLSARHGNNKIEQRK